ncbi:unnamed protein product [Sphagnum tenellum]
MTINDFVNRRALYSADLTVPIAVLDGRNLDIRCPDRNSELDGLQHVNSFCLVNAVLKALQQKTVKATTVIGLKIVDDAGITGLDLGRHIGRKVQDTCVSQLDAGREFLKGDMCVAVVENQKDFAVSKMKFKCVQPLQEDDLRHPSLCIASISAAQAAKVNVFETTGIFVFFDDPEGELVRTVSITAKSQGEQLFVLFAPLKLLCCEGTINLELKMFSQGQHQKKVKT